MQGFQKALIHASMWTFSRVLVVVDSAVVAYLVATIAAFPLYFVWAGIAETLPTLYEKVGGVSWKGFRDAGFILLFCVRLVR